MGHLQPLKTIYKPIPSLIIRNWPQVLLKDESGKLQLIRKCKYPVTPKTIKGLFTFTLKKKKNGHIWPQWKLLSPHCNTTAQWNSPSKTQVFSWRHRKVFQAQGREKGGGGGTQVTCAYAQLQCKTLFCSVWSPSTSPCPRKVREETRLGRTVSPWLSQHHPRPHGPLSG